MGIYCEQVYKLFADLPQRQTCGYRGTRVDDNLDVKIPKSDFVEEIVYFLPVIETEPIEYLYSDPSDLDSELQELEAIEERELRKSYEISGLVLKPTCDSLNEFTRQGMFIAKAMGIEKLRDGFHCFDKISEESGLEYVEG